MGNTSTDFLRKDEIIYFLEVLEFGPSKVPLWVYCPNFTAGEGMEGLMDSGIFFHSDVNLLNPSWPSLLPSKTLFNALSGPIARPRMRTNPVNLCGKKTVQKTVQKTVHRQVQSTLGNRKWSRYIFWVSYESVEAQKLKHEANTWKIAAFPVV